MTELVFKKHTLPGVALMVKCDYQKMLLPDRQIGTNTAAGQSDPYKLY